MSSKASISPETLQHNNLITKTQELAFKHFKLGNYNESITIYTKGIKFLLSLTPIQIEKIRLSYKLTARPADVKSDDPLYHPKFSSLLDSRAACYIKTGELRKALKDAKNMVRADPYSTKGHIRLGKVYELLKDEKLAYESYSKGLKYLDVGTKRFGIKYNNNNNNNNNSAAILQTAYKRLRSVLKEKKKKEPIKDHQSLKLIDPMDVLPFELIDLILRNLPFIQIVKQCLLVSRKWHEICSSLSMFDDIRIKPHCTLLDVQNCFNKIIKLKRIHNSSDFFSLRSLKIGNTGIGDERSIFKLLFYKTHLRILNTLDLQFNQIGIKDIIDSIKFSQNSENLFKNVQILKLQCLFNPRYEEILLQFLPNVRSLILIPSYDGSIGRLNLPKQYQFKNFVMKLKHLSILGDIKQPYISIPFQNLFIRDSKQLINLESLKIIGYDFTQLNIINETYNFLQRFPKLRHLILENNTNLTFKHLLKNHDILKFNNLQTFVFREKDVKYIESLNLFEISYLINIFHGLKILDLTNSSISYHALKILLQSIGSLKQLSIGSCPNLQFKSSGFLSNNPNWVNFFELLNFCPNLNKLQLNQSTGFSDYTLRELINVIGKFPLNPLQELQYLDLSFNDNLQGHSIIDLVSLLPNLKHLVIHGAYLSKETIDYLITKFGLKVESLIERKSWRVYGINTYDPFNC